MPAETDVGAISGQVTDDPGDPLPGVTVTATLSGNTNTAFTDSLGRYRMTTLAPGTYRVAFELTGFTPKRLDEEVKAGQTLSLNVALQLATP